MPVGVRAAQDPCPTGRNLSERDAVDGKKKTHTQKQNQKPKILISWPGPVFKRTTPLKELSCLVLQDNLKAEAQTKAHCFLHGSCLLHWC